MRQSSALAEITLQHRTRVARCAPDVRIVHEEVLGDHAESQLCHHLCGRRGFGGRGDFISMLNIRRSRTPIEGGCGLLSYRDSLSYIPLVARQLRNANFWLPGLSIIYITLLSYGVCGFHQSSST